LDSNDEIKKHYPSFVMPNKMVGIHTLLGIVIIKNQEN